MLKKQTLLFAFATLLTMSLHAQHVAVNGAVLDTLQLNEVIMQISQGRAKNASSK